MRVMKAHLFPFPICVSVAALLAFGCAEEPIAAREDAGIDGSAVDTDTWPEAVDPEIDWIEIPAGSFTWGSPEDTPCRGPYSEKEIPVTLTHTFIMARTEITQQQWAAMGFAMSPSIPPCDECPIHCLNMFEALAWCNALSRFEGLEECYDLTACSGKIGNFCMPDGISECTGLEEDEAFKCTGPIRRYLSMYDCAGYRLPTAAEWQYAAKAGTSTNTYNGDITEDSDGICVDEPILNDIAWYCFNTSGTNTGWQPEYIREVGLKQPNPWGLHDMLGNTAERVDWVNTGLPLDTEEGTPGQPLTDPMGAMEVEEGARPLFGGYYNDVPCRVRASKSLSDVGESRGPGYGFRPVRTMPAEAK